MLTLLPGTIIDLKFQIRGSLTLINTIFYLFIFLFNSDSRSVTEKKNSKKYTEQETHTKKQHLKKKKKKLQVSIRNKLMRFSVYSMKN